MSGGWSLDGFLSERDTYEDNIRASIAVASMDQLIVPGDYSEVALKEIKQDFNLSSISNRSSIDLTGQRLLDKSSYVSIGDRFYLKDVSQNKNTGLLDLTFSQDVGSIGSVQIYEVNNSGQPIRGGWSFGYPSPTKNGNIVSAVIPSNVSSSEKKFALVLTSGWSNSDGRSVEGQGNFYSGGLISNTFSYVRDTTRPTINNISKNNEHVITVDFSEYVQFGNSSANSTVGYLSKKARPTSMADIVHTYKVSDASIQYYARAKNY